MSRPFSPAAERNREPIREVLAAHLPDGARVLEIASGTGQHAAWFATHLDVRWQPTDADPTALASVEAWCAALPNVADPVALDVTKHASWPAGPFDAVFNANMIHISPWETCGALMTGAARVLEAGGLLFVYGPFMIDGRHTAGSNARFDVSLKSRDPSWGVRDLAVVTETAAEAGLERLDVVQMPANNLTLVFERRG